MHTIELSKKHAAFGCTQFYPLKHMQNFDAHNSSLSNTCNILMHKILKKKAKINKHSVYKDLKHMQHPKNFCKIKEQNLIFTQKTHSLASKYFIENMKLKFPTMKCNFKTNPASMHTHTVNFSFLLGWGVWN